MKLLAILGISTLLISACTPYRSADRASFDKEYAESNSSHSSATIQNKCRNIGKLEQWFLEEFPNHNYELIVSNDTYEVWKTTRTEEIVIYVFTRSNSEISLCEYNFEQEKQWLNNKESILEQLELNVFDVQK